MVLTAEEAGFSSALGAFVMGSILAETVESHRIEKLMTPLKNVFAAIFFISVGMDGVIPYVLYKVLHKSSVSA